MCGNQGSSKALIDDSMCTELSSNDAAELNTTSFDGEVDVAIRLDAAQQVADVSANDEDSHAMLMRNARECRSHRMRYGDVSLLHETVARFDKQRYSRRPSGV